MVFRRLVVLVPSEIVDLVGFSIVGIINMVTVFLATALVVGGNAYDYADRFCSDKCLVYFEACLREIGQEFELYSSSAEYLKDYCEIERCSCNLRCSRVFP